MLRKDWCWKWLKQVREIHGGKCHEVYEVCFLWENLWSDLSHRLLYTWTEDYIIFFPNFMPAKSAKYGFTIICRYLIWRVWLKNWVCHALLNFKIEMGVAGSIFELNPSNFVTIHIFWISTDDSKTIFCWLCWYRIWKKDNPVLRPGVKESMH